MSDDISVTKQGHKLTASWSMPGPSDAFEPVLREVLHKFHEAIEARLDELIAAGYRGPMFAWMTYTPSLSRQLLVHGRAEVQVHTGITEPSQTEDVMTTVQRYDIDDGIAAAWVELKAKQP